jgi:glycosyltransferase involved in cell wall biosynthesis
MADYVKDQRVLVIIPAYNEEENVVKTVHDVREKAPFVDILVVDDASKDRTLYIARQLGVMVVAHCFNLGIGGAVQTGLKIAKLKGYDIAIQVDADCQHDAAYIPQLIKPIVEGRADIVIGSRYLTNKNTHNTKNISIRRLGIRFFSWIATKAIGHKITDCTSGFRALNKNAINLFAEDYPIDFPDAEALILAHKNGLQITEMPVKFHSRMKGKSSLRFWRFLYYPVKEMLSILMLIIRNERRIK